MRGGQARTSGVLACTWRLYLPGLDGVGAVAVHWSGSAMKGGWPAHRVSYTCGATVWAPAAAPRGHRLAAPKPLPPPPNPLAPPPPPLEPSGVSRCTATPGCAATNTSSSATILSRTWRRRAGAGGGGGNEGGGGGRRAGRAGSALGARGGEQGVAECCGRAAGECQVQLVQRPSYVATPCPVLSCPVASVGPPRVFRGGMRYAPLLAP